jgi:hypothetical protein
LRGGRIDQKRLDALEMLEVMRGVPESLEAASSKFSFEWTVFWDEFVRAEAVPRKSGLFLEQRIIDELRLEGPEAYARVEALALLRMIAAGGTAQPAGGFPREKLQKTWTDVRASLGLFTRARLDCWMARNDMNTVSLENLICNETYLKDLRDRSTGALEPFLLDELRLSGAYERLAERARKKNDALRAIEASTAGTPGVSHIVLRLWFFEQRLKCSVPDNIEDYARQHGFANAAALDAMLQRERLYLEIEPSAKSA